MTVVRTLVWAHYMGRPKLAPFLEKLSTRSGRSTIPGDLRAVEAPGHVGGAKRVAYLERHRLGLSLVQLPDTPPPPSRVTTPLCAVLPLLGSVE
jgi:hypothetical protein